MHLDRKGRVTIRPLPYMLIIKDLVVERSSLPECLEVTGALEDGTIMGLQHRELPIHGVQFHPESIRSEHGHKMLQNFLDTMAVPA